MLYLEFSAVMACWTTSDLNRCWSIPKRHEIRFSAANQKCFLKCRLFLLSKNVNCFKAWIAIWNAVLLSCLNKNHSLIHFENDCRISAVLMVHSHYYLQVGSKNSHVSMYTRSRKSWYTRNHTKCIHAENIRSEINFLSDHPPPLSSTHIRRRFPVITLIHAIACNNWYENKDTFTLITNKDVLGKLNIYNLLSCQYIISKL